VFNVRLPTKEQVAEASEYLATRVGQRPTRSWEENYARETTLMADWPATKELKLQALRIGDFGIGAIPCETYGSTGLAIKRASPFPLTMVIGLANGCSGYLPPPDQFALGGYSTWRARSSYLETGAEPKIVTTLNELLQQVRSRRIAQGSMTLPPERRPPARRLRTSPNQKRRVGDRRSATLFPFCWQCHAPIAQ